MVVWHRSLTPRPPLVTILTVTAMTKIVLSTISPFPFKPPFTSSLWLWRHNYFTDTRMYLSDTNVYTYVLRTYNSLKRVQRSGMNDLNLNSCPSIHPSIRLPVCLFISPSVHPSVRLSFMCLSFLIPWLTFWVPFKSTLPPTLDSGFLAAFIFVSSSLFSLLYFFLLLIILIITFFLFCVYYFLYCILVKLFKCSTIFGPVFSALKTRQAQENWGYNHTPPSRSSLFPHTPKGVASTSPSLPLCSPHPFHLHQRFYLFDTIFWAQQRKVEFSSLSFCLRQIFV